MSSTLPCLLCSFLTHSFDRHAWLRIAPRFAPKSMLWAGVLFAWLLAVTLSHGSSAKFIYFDF